MLHRKLPRMEEPACPFGDRAVRALLLPPRVLSRWASAAEGAGGRSWEGLRRGQFLLGLGIYIVLLWFYVPFNFVSPTLH